MNTSSCQLHVHRVQESGFILPSSALKCPRRKLGWNWRDRTRQSPPLHVGCMIFVVFFPLVLPACRSETWSTLRRGKPALVGSQHDGARHTIPYLDHWAWTLRLVGPREWKGGRGDTWRHSYQPLARISAFQVRPIGACALCVCVSGAC